MSELENHPNILAAKAKGTFGFVDVGCSAPWPDEAIIAATGGCYPAPVQLADGRWVGPASITMQGIVLAPRYAPGTEPAC